MRNRGAIYAACCRFHWEAVKKKKSVNTQIRSLNCSPTVEKPRAAGCINRAEVISS